MTTGVSTNDFAQILEDFKRTVSYKVNTKTVSGMGDETSTFAAASNKDVIYFLNENKYLFDKEGLIEVGDAYIMANLTDAIKRYDQFTVDGLTYYIENVIRRYIVGVAMFDYGRCFKVT